MAGQQGYYSFETFQADSADFDSKFSDFLNERYDAGWKYKSCTFCREEGKAYASCLFKASHKRY